MTEAPKLKPCPFCGGAPLFILPARRGSFDRIYPIVRCGGCYLDMPGGNDDYSPEGKSAVRAWNTRADDHAALREAADKLAEALAGLVNDYLPEAERTRDYHFEQGSHHALLEEAEAEVARLHRARAALAAHKEATE